MGLGPHFPEAALALWVCRVIFTNTNLAIGAGDQVLPKLFVVPR